MATMEELASLGILCAEDFVCACCDTRIQPDDPLVAAHGRIFLESHFKCKICNELLSNFEHYCTLDGQEFFCPPHDRFFNYKICTLCGEVILDQAEVWKDEYFFHTDCFKCSVCNKQPEEYNQKSGRVLCNDHLQTHYRGPPCSICAIPIPSKYVVLASGRKLHEKCFRCGWCDNPLTQRTHSLLHGKLSCFDCGKLSFSELQKRAMSLAEQQFTQRKSRHTFETLKRHKTFGLVMSRQHSSEGFPSAGNARTFTSFAVEDELGNAQSPSRQPPKPRKMNQEDSNSSLTSPRARSRTRTPTAHSKPPTKQLPTLNVPRPSVVRARSAPMYPNKIIKPTSSQEKEIESMDKIKSTPSPLMKSISVKTSMERPLQHFRSPSTSADEDQSQTTIVSRSRTDLLEESKSSHNRNISREIVSRRSGEFIPPPPRKQLPAPPGRPLPKRPQRKAKPKPKITPFPASLKVLKEGWLEYNQLPSTDVSRRWCVMGDNSKLYHFSDKEFKGKQVIDFSSIGFLEIGVGQFSMQIDKNAYVFKTEDSDTVDSWVEHLGDDKTRRLRIMSTEGALVQTLDEDPYPSESPGAANAGSVTSMLYEEVDTDSDSDSDEDGESYGGDEIDSDDMTQIMPLKRIEPQNSRHLIISSIEAPKQMDEDAFVDYTQAQHQQGTVVSYNLQSADNSPLSTEEVDFPEDVHLELGSDSNTQDTTIDNHTGSVLYGVSDTDSDSSGNYEEEVQPRASEQSIKRLQVVKQAKSVIGSCFKIGSFAEHPPDSPSTKKLLEKSSLPRDSGLFLSANSNDDDMSDYRPPVSPHRMPVREEINWKKGNLIGTGAYGQVYLGLNTDNGEMIAVKEIPLHGKQEKQYLEIRNEVDLMRKLRHPHIVALYAVEQRPNFLNIIMEYVPGRSLDYFYETFGPLDEQTIRLYTLQMCQALRFIHNENVVHRDIKAKNILVDARGNIKLGDFGSAKFLGDSMAEMKASEGLNYTALWCAPEVFQGKYNFKIDIWSLGCVLIEISTAKPPWAEMKFSSPFAAMFHIGNSDDIPKIPEHLSDRGKNFIGLCVTRDPTKRCDAKRLLSHRFVTIATKR